MSDRELIEMLVDVVKANTEASEKMAAEVRGLRATIQGAQRKIGQELGPAIDKVKATQKALNEEVRAVRRAGS